MKIRSFTLVVMLAMPACVAAASAPAAAVNTAIIITSVTAGAADPNEIIPTENGVRGAGVDNWDIADPTAILQNGQRYNFSASFDDLSYTGSCEERLKVTQEQNGKRVLLFGVTRFGGNCSPGTDLFSSGPILIPDSPGPVELSVTVTFGADHVSMKVPMEIA
ncbi:MAG: hypothetical protein ACREHF_08815 [Rhizomicrobium sp.]